MFSQIIKNLSLTNVSNPELTFYWYDAGADETDINKRILITTEKTGPLNLVSTGNGKYKSTGFFNLIDTVYDDDEALDNEFFYTSYKKNYQQITLSNSNEDLDVTVTQSPDGFVEVGDEFENSSLTFDLNKFASLVTRTTFTSSFTVNLKTNLKYLNVVNNVDGLDNTLKIKFQYLDFQRGFTVPEIREVYIGDVGAKLDISVNSLTKNSYIIVETDYAANEENLNLTNLPHPSIPYANVLPLAPIAYFNFGQDSKQVNLTIPTNIPPEYSSLKIGSWNYKLTFRDGLFTQTKNVKMVVFTNFKEPSVTVEQNKTLNVDDTNINLVRTVYINVAYDQSDVSNNIMQAWDSHLDIYTYIAKRSATNVESSDLDDFINLYASTTTNPGPPVTTIYSKTAEMPRIGLFTGPFQIKFNYNGRGDLIGDYQNDYCVIVKTKPHNSTTWTYSKQIDFTITKPYTTKLNIVNNHDGSYSGQTVSIPSGDKYALIDASTNQIYSSNYDVSGTLFTVSDQMLNGKSYRYAIVNNLGYIYTETISDSFAIKYSPYDVTTIKLNLTTYFEANGTYYDRFLRVSPVTLGVNDNMVVYDASTNQVATEQLVDNKFIGEIGKSYYVVVCNGLDKYVKTQSDTILSYGSTNLTMYNNCDGTVTIENVPTLFYSDGTNTDRLKVVDSSDIEITVTNNKFNVSENKTYSAFILTNGNKPILKSNSVLIPYDVNNNITFRNNYNGVFSIVFQKDSVDVPLSGTDKFYIQKYLNLTDPDLNSPPIENTSRTFSGLGIDGSYYRVYLGTRTSQRNDALTYYTNSSNVTLYKYNTSLVLYDNYDGTLKIQTPPFFDSVNDKFILDGTNEHIDYNDNFVGTKGRTYRAMIRDKNTSYVYLNVVSTSITVKYDQNVVIVNNYDGTFTAKTTDTVISGDKIVIFNCDENGVIIQEMDYGETFIGVENNYYIATIKTTLTGKYYTNLMSNVIKVNYVDHLVLVDNYDGTITVTNPPTLEANDSVVLLQKDDDTFIQYLTPGNSFTYAYTNQNLNKFLYATIQRTVSVSEKYLLQHTESNTVQCKYLSRLRITMNSTTGMYTVGMSDSLKGTDKIVVFEIDSSNVKTETNYGIVFEGIKSKKYTATVKSGQNYYTHIESESITKYYNTNDKLRLIDNHNGTITIDNLQPVMMAMKENGQNDYLDRRFPNTPLLQDMKLVFVNRINNATITISLNVISYGWTNEGWPIEAQRIAFLTQNYVSYLTPQRINVVGKDPKIYIQYDSNMIGSGLFTNMNSDAFDVKYINRLTITDNVDGTYSVVTPDTVQNNDIIVIKDDTNEFTYNGISFVASKNVLYYAMIKSNGTNNEQHTMSDSFINYYDSKIVVMPKYDGNYMIAYNPKIESNGDTVIMKYGSSSFEVTSYNTIIPPSNMPWYLIIKSGLNNKEYKQTQSDIITENEFRTVNIKIKDTVNLTDTDITQTLINNGLNVNITSDNDVVPTTSTHTVKRSTDTNVNFKINVEKPAWLINKDGYVVSFRIYVTEIFIDSDANNTSNISSINLQNFTKTQPNTYYERLLTNNDIINSTFNFNGTIIQKTGRTNSSYYVIYCAMFYGGVCVSAAFCKYFSRPDTSHFLGNKFNNIIVRNIVNFVYSPTNLTPDSTMIQENVQSVSIWSIDDLSTINCNLCQQNLMYSGSENTIFTHTVDQNSVSISYVGNCDVNKNYTIPSLDVTNKKIVTNYFTGYIDITYNDICKGVTSENTNKIRLIVIPRQNLTYNIINTSGNTVAYTNPIYLRQSARNIQTNNGNDISFNSNIQILQSNGTPTTNNSIITLLNALTQLSFGTRNMLDSTGSNIDNGLFSVVQENNGNYLNEMFSLIPTVINYGTLKEGIIKFNGKTQIDETTSLSYTSSVVYNKYRSGTSEAQSSFVLGDNVTSLIYEPNINSRIFNVGNQINIQDVVFCKYLTSTSNVNLTNTFSNSIFIIIENIDLQPITVTYSATRSALELYYNKRAFFMKSNFDSSNSTNEWSCLGFLEN